MRPTIATIHIPHLLYNYQLLQQQAAPSEVMAVVKADAYGHGLLPVSEALYSQGCRSFAVTDAIEGGMLRSFFQEHDARDAEIHVLSGFFDEQGALLCQKYALTPVVSEIYQLALLKQVNFTSAVWLKVDSGMKRMGVADVGAFVAQAQEYQLEIRGMMSHLACADTPNHQLNQQQMQYFSKLQLSYPKFASSLFNSAGVLAFAPSYSTDIVRPGIALYGVEPIPEIEFGLKPVMQLSASIIQIRPIAVGESVSYGATWTSDKPAQIAVVAMGYADGLSRLLSNQGEVLHHSGRLPIVGRVCMDYCMLAVDTDLVKVGDAVIFFGFDVGAPHVNAVATQCQTISYELFTSISARVPRIYRQE